MSPVNHHPIQTQRFLQETPLFYIPCFERQEKEGRKERFSQRPPDADTWESEEISLFSTCIAQFDLVIQRNHSERQIVVSTLSFIKIYTRELKVHHDYYHFFPCFTYSFETAVTHFAMVGDAAEITSV